MDHQDLDLPGDHQLDHEGTKVQTNGFGKLSLVGELGSGAGENRTPMGYRELPKLCDSSQSNDKECYINHQTKHCFEDDYVEPVVGSQDHLLVEGYLNMRINGFGKVIEQQLSKGLQTLQLKASNEKLEPKSRSE